MHMNVKLNIALLLLKLFTALYWG